MPSKEAWRDDVENVLSSKEVYLNHSTGVAPQDAGYSQGTKSHDNDHFPLGFHGPTAPEAQPREDGAKKVVRSGERKLAALILTATFNQFHDPAT